jgi:hypothetical protein
MKRNWPIEDLVEYWTLLPNELTLLDNKTGPTRLGFALLLKFFQLEARFPYSKNEIPRVVVAYVAKQLALDPLLYLQYDWRGRAIKYHRAQIRDFLGFREPTLAEEAELTEWLCAHVLAQDQDLEHLQVVAANQLRALHIELPVPDRFARLIRSALRTYEERLFNSILEKLSPTTRTKLQQLLQAQAQVSTNTNTSTDRNNTPATSVEAAVELAEPIEPTLEAATSNYPAEPDRAFWLELRRDPGRASLASSLVEIAKLQRLRQTVGIAL